MALRLEGLQKTYGAIRAVDGVTLELPPGRTLALLGPSGCGKSTLLRLIAGLDEPDAGRLLDDDHDITPLPPQRRGFGMVFQDYALFPHLNVEQNIAFGLVESGWSKAQRRARVMELLELVGLPGTEKRRTFELSGGQQQRV
ncbi:MAG TPA: ATP-binding cassette domain-containing protein, partial [Trueperaceae bacterium]